MMHYLYYATLVILVLYAVFSKYLCVHGLNETLWSLHLKIASLTY